jgi:pimeloyl-ACP methyl ester carboxylesterase
MATASQDHATETIELSTGGIHLYRGGAGEPLVVLHHDIGTPGWIPFYEQLARHYSVYVPELPGFGTSSPLEWARHPRDVAAVMQQFLNRLGLTAITLVGLGFGGWLAAEMAACNETRLRQLVLVGAAGLRPPDGEIQDQFLSAAGEYIRSGFADPAAFESTFGAIPSAEQELAWDIHREVIARITWKPYMVSYQLPALLTGLTVPTLVVWGAQDKIVPLSAGERYARLIPGARLVVLEGAGHFIEIEQPDQVAASILEHARTLTAVSRRSVAASPQQLSMVPAHAGKEA